LELEKERMSYIDRTALVTGGNTGIGRAIAEALIADGFTVHVGSRDPEKGRAAVAELGKRAVLLPLDVTDADSIRTAAQQVPRLDVLVNNAGIGDAGETVLTVDLGLVRRIYETNVLGVVAMTAAFAPALRGSAHPRIVNISSGTGSLSWSTGANPQFDWTRSRGGGLAYRSSKAALNAVTVYSAQALSEDRVLVNALAPGLRRTKLNALAASTGGDPAEAAAGALRLATLPDSGPTGGFFSWDGTPVPW
jgi:NAD(P)-dependent dehydrogenase (short-subunit alcohol dehydrogenase family)